MGYHSAATVVIGVRDEAKKGGVAKKGAGENALLGSTGIRAEFTERGCTDEVIDDIVARKVLGRAVGECLKQKTKQVACACCEGIGIYFGNACPLCAGLAHFPDDEQTPASAEEPV